MVEAGLPLPQRTLRVGELTRYLKYMVEHDDLLTALSIRGELSDLSRAPSGHVYFSLKDDTGQISCVLFRREAVQQQDEVRELRKGIVVVVHGFLTIYEPRGAYQVYVERVLPQGEGAEHQRLERLRAQLEKEGLFAADRKRTLSVRPRKIALITSPGSQAYHDVLHRLQAQFPFVQVIEAGASVQGPGAADEMVMALDIVNRLTDADTILLVRGGGASDELAPFNEERLARAIFASRIPVVTGIGHQTDFTIADLVADHRAATPSLAAAAVVPDVAALMGRIAGLHGEMERLTAQHLSSNRRRWIDVNRALLRSEPAERLRTQRKRVDDLGQSATRAMAMHLRAKRSRLTAVKAQLDALDPLTILGRGYAVLSDPHTGRVISRTGDVGDGMALQARLSDGVISVRVEKS